MSSYRRPLPKLLCTLFLAASLALFAISADAESDVAIAEYLDQLSSVRGFELNGLGLVGSDVFEALGSNVSTEKAVERALNRYNHVVQFSNNQVRRVVILGRKGTDVGALPEDSAEPTIEQ
ncbi:MAG: hypothetical protein ACI9HA_000927 [Dinoroseobacter sp.]